MTGIRNRKQIISWCMFDFANSSYSAVIAAVVFPVYYATQIVGNQNGLGDLWWGRAVSLSMAVVAVTSPFMGGIADYGGIRKRLLFAYTSVCIVTVTSLSFLQKGMVFEGFLLIVLANMGLEGGLVFYNSFLPEIAEKEYQGRVSAWGYAIGYAGSILSLIVAIPLVKTGHFGETWLMVAAFFALFSLPAFLSLPRDRTGLKIIRAASQGFRCTWSTFREIWAGRESRRFLIAYLVYEDGVNTVIVFSSIFAASTLGFKPQELIGLYLIVQITALIGAFLMARPIDSLGPKKVVSLSLLLWTSVLRYRLLHLFESAFLAPVVQRWPGSRHCPGSDQGVLYAVHPPGSRIRIFRGILNGGKILCRSRTFDLWVYLLDLWQSAACDTLDRAFFPDRPHHDPVREGWRAEYQSLLLKSAKNLSLIFSEKGLPVHSSRCISMAWVMSSSKTAVISRPNPSSSIPTFPSSFQRRD